MDRADHLNPGWWWLVLSLVAVCAAVVLTTFGWYSALNATIPLLVGVLWLLVFTVACWGAGTAVLRRWLAGAEYDLENTLLVLLAGAGTMATTSALLAVFHLLYPPVLTAALALWACTGAIRVHRMSRWSHPEPLHLRELPWLIIILVAGVAGLAAATTMAPFYDQWHYTLGFPYHWLRNGTILTFPNHAYSMFPANMGLLYAYPLAGPGGWAAQLIHWWMAVMAMLCASVIARRLGASRPGQLVAAAIFIATPSVVQLSALAGTDLGIAAFAGGAVVCLLRQVVEPSSIVWSLLCGVFIGLAAGVKYLAMTTVAVPIGILLLVGTAVGGPSRARVRQLAQLTVLTLAATIMVAPWLIRNAVVIGNPVHPYFASVFGGAPLEPNPPSSEIAQEIGGFELDRTTIRTAVTLGTFETRGHASNIGPVHLWLLPVGLFWLIARRSHHGSYRVAGFIVLSVLAWSMGPTLGRYLLSTLVVTSAVAGTVWANLDRHVPTTVGVALTLMLSAVLLGNCNPLNGEYLADQLACFAGSRHTDEYLLTGCTQLAAFRVANESLPEEAHILLLGEPRPYALDRQISVSGPFETSWLVQLANASQSPREIAQQLSNRGVTHILWNRAEADRLARSLGRQQYLEFSSPDAKQRFERFFSEQTSAVARGEWWEIRSVHTP